MVDNGILIFGIDKFAFVSQLPFSAVNPQKRNEAIFRP